MIARVSEEPGGNASDESLQRLIRQGRIVFGCARLHHLRNPALCERLLHAAMDAGLRQFDVAPAYGSGFGERVLGHALRSGHQDAVVNTKVGIPVWIYPRLGDPVFPVLRALEMLSGTHRRAYARRDFRPATLRRSLEQSLRRLQINRIDTFFLHEPVVPFSSSEWRDITETMIRLREVGKIRTWGIAGSTRRYELPQLRGHEPIIVQQPFAELDQRPPAFVQSRVAFSTFSAFRGAPAGSVFREYLERAAARHPDTSFLVSTIDRTRLDRWLGEPRP